MLLLAYALGAATSLALALLVGGKVFARMKKSLGASERIRQVLGVLVLVGVAAIALGLDTRVLAKLSSAQTASLESSIARKLGVGGIAAESRTSIGKDGMLMLPVEGALAAARRARPVDQQRSRSACEQLRGKVVVIDFWTYSCINCLRSIPYVRAWHEKYAKDGLVIIGVHAPEFAFERNPDNVAQGGRRPRHPLPGRARQPIHIVGRAQEPILAGALLRRCQGPGSLPPFRRRQICRIGAGHPPAAGRSRARADGRRTGAGDRHARAPKRPRPRRRSSRPKPISAMAAPTASPHPAG